VIFETSRRQQTVKKINVLESSLQ